MHDISSLLDISETVPALVFDAFVVLNVGETLIPGADHRLNQLRALGCDIRILTNVASYDRPGAAAKFQRLGLQIEDGETITSRDPALCALTPGLWGAIVAPEDALGDIKTPDLRLADADDAYQAADDFLFLSSSGWTRARKTLLTASLLARPGPVLIANADLAAPRDDGFSLEPGYFGHLLVGAVVPDVRFFGKSFAEVYDLVAQSLPDTPPGHIVMC